MGVSQMPEEPSETAKWEADKSPDEQSGENPEETDRWEVEKESGDTEGDPDDS
jgi:hypothetical protein